MLTGDLNRRALIADILRAGHPVTFQVAGASMRPLFWPGDRFHIAPARSNQLRVGDIALVELGEQLAAHRVISVSPLVTRGDSLLVDDGVVAPEAVLGQVIAFTRRSVTVRLDRPTGRLLSAVSRRLGSCVAHAELLKRYRG